MIDLRQKILEAITEDIINRKDGAGSDLRYAEVQEEGVWIELEGALDISALTNTILAALPKFVVEYTREGADYSAQTATYTRYVNMRRLKATTPWEQI